MTLEPLAVNINGAAHMLGVDPTIVRRLIRQGHLRAVVLPTMREKRIPVSALKDLLEAPPAELEAVAS